MPRSLKSINWLKTHFMVKEGYSMEDIDSMDNDQYDYINNFIMEWKAKGLDNPLQGGL